MVYAQLLLQRSYAFLAKKCSTSLEDYVNCVNTCSSTYSEQNDVIECLNRDCVAQMGKMSDCLSTHSSTYESMLAKQASSKKQIQKYCGTSFDNEESFRNEVQASDPKACNTAIRAYWKEVIPTKEYPDSETSQLLMSLALGGMESGEFDDKSWGSRSG
jgi:hypothetical protein